MLEFPEGTYELYADDDDVIGLTVAKTYPKGYAMIRTEPPIMDAFDEYEVGKFLAWCLSNHAKLCNIIPSESGSDPLRYDGPGAGDSGG